MYEDIMLQWLKKVILAPLAGCLLLAGCYIPDQYQGELRLSKSGAYALEYKGNLIWTSIYEKIKAGTLTPEEVTEKIAVLERDLKRNTRYMKSVVHVGDSVFKVHYLKSAYLPKTKEDVFVRRNSRIFTIKLHQDNVVSITSIKLNKKQINQFAAKGINSSGRFRVVTDADVLEHNASFVKDGADGYKIYDWDLKSVFSPAVKMFVRLSPPT
jgi:hypothetical protein